MATSGSEGLLLPVAAVETLYRHCHLRPPLVLTPRSAVDFARTVTSVARLDESAFVAAALIALPCLPLVLAAVELKQWIQSDAALRAIDIGLVAYAACMVVALTSWFLARLAWPRRSLWALLLGHALGAASGASIATLLEPDWGIMIIGAGAGGAVAALAQVLVALTLPLRRRWAMRVRSGLAIPLHGSRPIHDIVRSRLEVAVQNTPDATAGTAHRMPPSSRQEERPETAARIEAEGRRLADYRWHSIRPLLGNGTDSSTRLSLARAARRVVDPDDLPAVLQAAIALDANADAVSLFEGVAVVLPSGSAIEAVVAPQDEPRPARRRSAHPSYRRVLALLGDGFFLGRLVDLAWSDRIADRLLVGHIDRTQDSMLRDALVQAMGVERFIGAARIAPAHTDETGALYLIGSARDPLAYVRVEDGTPTPDGTRAAHWLRVPPHVATAREAVAWTFGLPEHTYYPSVET